MKYQDYQIQAKRGQIGTENDEFESFKPIFQYFWLICPIC